jgi:hypothetical protein
MGELSSYLEAQQTTNAAKLLQYRVIINEFDLCVCSLREFDDLFNHIDL